MKNILSAAMVLIGTFIGAGFASGQEILQYFGVFGNMGIWGILISSTLLFAFAYCTADNVVCMDTGEYTENLCRFRCVRWLLNGYMLLIFATMLTAFGECLEQAYSFPKIYGVVLMDLVTMLILHFDAQGMIKLNSFITPIIILGIIFLYCANNVKSVFAYNNFVTSAAIYTSYNIISMPFVLLGMKDMLDTKKKIFFSSLMFSFVIFMLAVFLLRLLELADMSLSIPILEAVSKNYTNVFIVILAMSMLTTAVSNGYGFLKGVNINKNITLAFIGILGLVFSLFNFEFVVKYLYSFFGYLGIYVLFINFYVFMKNREKPRNLKINRNKLK